MLDFPDFIVTVLSAEYIEQFEHLDIETFCLIITFVLIRFLKLLKITEKSYKIKL